MFNSDIFLPVSEAIKEINAQVTFAKKPK